MREEKVEIKTADGTADAFVYAPDGQGPWPAVLYYPDGIGIRPAFHQMAQRLAGEGYVVLLPNIYYRTTTGPFFDFPLDFNDPKTRQRFVELSGPLTPPAMERDALGYLEFLGQRSDVNGRMGVVGYCLTGRMVKVENLPIKTHRQNDNLHTLCKAVASYLSSYHPETLPRELPLKQETFR